MIVILDLAYLLLAIAITPMVLYRMLRHARYRTGWAQRFGKVTRKDPFKKCIWIHAVSVGEVNATKTIIEALRKKFPDFEIVISTTTDTGFARANALFADRLTVFYFPLDFSPIRYRSFRNIRPAICLLMELEVWPNFVLIAHKLKIPLVVVNGRITAKSYSRYKLVKPLAKAIFQKITLILAQTEEYARRFKEIGAPHDHIIVVSSLKYDTAQIADSVDGANELAAQLNIENEKLWVAGGTGNNEEKILIDVYRKLIAQKTFRNLRFAIIPRKPERFDEVARLIEQNGFGCIRYSQLKGTTASAPKTDSKTIILGDTMGDLRKFYSLATIVFIGRSLVPMGGSDMIEAAALKKCCIFGPHTFNFAQTVEALLEDEAAILVNDQNDLFHAIRKCLTEPNYARKIAQNAQQTIRKNQGATQKTTEQIAKILKTV